MARPRNTVRDHDGREVYGLSVTWDKKARKHRYYITASKPTKRHADSVSFARACFVSNRAFDDCMETEVPRARAFGFG